MVNKQRRRKGYRQACNIARTLDLVGDRWTLLLLRELFTGPRSYGQLEEGLLGIGTNLLAARLKQLEADGLIVRQRAEGMRKRRVYGLTERGRLMEPVLIEMVKFGLRAGLVGDELDISRPSWAILSSKAVFRADQAAGLDEQYEFHVGDEVFHLGVRGGRTNNGPGPATAPVVTVEMDEETFERVEKGTLKLAQGVWTGEIEVIDGHAGALDRCDQIFGS